MRRCVAADSWPAVSAAGSVSALHPRRDEARSKGVAGARGVPDVPEEHGVHLNDHLAGSHPPPGPAVVRP